MSCTILITGSNGLLGQKLVHLLKEKYNVIATSLGSCLISNQSGFIYQSLDITNEYGIGKIFNMYRPKYVINTAAMTNVDACEDYKDLCDDINVKAVGYISKECEKYNSHLIHISTDFIFDGKNGPYDENDDANPLSYYGLSKWKSEQEILKLNDEKFNVTALRFSTVFGGSPRLRCDIVFNNLLANAYTKNKY